MPASSVETRAEIGRPPAQIWTVLLAVQDWPDWWPGVEKAAIESSWQPGGRLTLVLKKNPERSLARITEVQRSRELAWTRQGVLGSSTFTRWRLLPTAVGTTVYLESRIRGPQAFLARLTGRKTFEKYQQMVLESLKSRLGSSAAKGHA